MERRYFSLADIYTDANVGTNCRNCSSGKESTVPGCINTDFCVTAPQQKSDGILTMAFVNMQPLDRVYPPETALLNGTLFPDIDKPFFGGMYR